MRNKTVLPRLIAAVAALGVIACTFVFPYIVSAKSGTGETVDLIVGAVGDLPVRVVPEMRITDVKSMTLYRFVRVNSAILAEEAAKSGKTEDKLAAVIYAALFMTPALCAAVCFFCALANRAIPAILFSLLNGWLTVLVYRWMGRYNIPNSAMKWGPARLVFFAFSALLLAMGIAMFAAKIKMKRMRRQARCART